MAGRGSGITGGQLAFGLGAVGILAYAVLGRTTQAHAQPAPAPPGPGPSTTPGTPATVPVTPRVTTPVPLPEIVFPEISPSPLALSRIQQDLRVFAYSIGQGWARDVRSTGVWTPVMYEALRAFKRASGISGSKPLAQVADALRALAVQRARMFSQSLPVPVPAPTTGAVPEKIRVQLNTLGYTTITDFVIDRTPDVATTSTALGISGAAAAPTALDTLYRRYAGI